MLTLEPERKMFFLKRKTSIGMYVFCQPPVYNKEKFTTYLIQLHLCPTWNYNKIAMNFRWENIKFPPKFVLPNKVKEVSINAVCRYLSGHF